MSCGPGGLLGAGECGRGLGTPPNARGARRREQRDKGPVRAALGDCGLRGALGTSPGRPQGWRAGTRGLKELRGDSGAAGRLHSLSVTVQRMGKTGFKVLSWMSGGSRERAGPGQTLLQLGDDNTPICSAPLIFLGFCICVFQHDVNINF